MESADFPRSLGPYLLVEEVGRGGMGTVYRALDSEGENVAIKVIRADLEDEYEVRRRFHREARAAARLVHPNIVRLLDFNTENDQTYMVMEYVGGGTLIPWRTSPPDGDTLRQVFISILEALAYAHSRGVVHRDLKPENVLLHATLDGHPDPRVLDFGVAHLRDEALPDGTSGYVGTPEYISPEQVLNPADISSASDLYAIGIMLFEVVCGYLPFSKSSSEATVVAQVNAPVPPVVVRDGYMACPALEQVITRLLAKHPYDRYLCAVDVIDALKKCTIKGQPSSLSWASTDGQRPTHQMAVSTLRTRRRSSGPRPGVKPGSVGLVSLRDPQFIGRENELRRAAGWVAECLTTRQGRLIAVRGEAGTGKTRLVQELAATIEQTGSMQVWRGRATRENNDGDSALRQVFRHGLHLEGLSHAQCEQRIQQWLERQGSDDPWEEKALLEYLGPDQKQLTSLASEPARWALLERVLRRTASRRPVLIWVDDAHTADGEVFRFAQWLEERRATNHWSWCFVLSGRLVGPTVNAGWHALNDETDAHVMRLDVETLADETIARMLSGQLSIGLDLAMQVAAKAAGNPRIGIELVRYLLDNDFLHSRNLADTLHRQLPDAVRTIVNERVAEAAAQVRHPDVLDLSLNILAVSGVPTTFAEVLETLYALGRKGVAQHLDEALTAALVCGLIREDEPGVFHYESETFADVVRARGPQSVSMQTIHRAFALALTSLQEPRSYSATQRVARLFEAGGELEQALRYYEASARIARLRSSHDRALRSWTSVLDLTKASDDPAVHAGYSRALRGSAQALLALGQVEEAERVALAIRAARSDWEGEVQLLLATIAFRKGDLRDARERFTSAHALLKHGEPGSWAEVGLELAQLELLEGQVHEAERILLQCREAFQVLGDTRGEAAALQGLAQTAERMGLLEEALNYVGMSAELYRHIGDRLGSAECNLVTADIELLRGNVKEAGLLYEAARQTFQSLGEMRLAYNASVGMGRSREARAMHSEARALYTDSLEGYQRLRDRTGETICLMALAHLDASIALWSQAEARFEEVARRDQHQRIDDVNLVAMMIDSARLALRAGRTKTGRTLLQSAEQKLARMGSDTFLADQVDEVHFLIHENTAGQGD